MPCSNQNLHEKYFTIGPLTLDICNKLAYTSIGTELFLSSYQFDMLHALALRECEALSYHAIFDAAYKGSSLDMGEACAQLYSLISIIKAAGLGFMWIEKTSDSCSFVTKWNNARMALAL